MINLNVASRRGVAEIYNIDRDSLSLRHASDRIALHCLQQKPAKAAGNGVWVMHTSSTGDKRMPSRKLFRAFKYPPRPPRIPSSLSLNLTNQSSTLCQIFNNTNYARVHPKCN
jgi:hypothetical protein